MYFTNRSHTDKIGLSLTYGLIAYIGILSAPAFLWEDIKDWQFTRISLALLNGLVILDLLLLICVSSTRGYVKEDEYVPGGKFCYECRKAKPERAHHCSRCKKCISKMDHHCPWVGVCINSSNLGNFIKLITCICASSVVALFLHAYVFRLKIRVIYDSVMISPKICFICVNILLTLLAGTGSFFILVRQLKFMLRNVTYLEYLQVKKLNKLGVLVPNNPYDNGYFENVKSVIGGPVDFLLCRSPESAEMPSYKNYWPPLRMSKSVSSSQVRLNTLVEEQIENN